MKRLYISELGNRSEGAEGWENIKITIIRTMIKSIIPCVNNINILFMSAN